MKEEGEKEGSMEEGMEGVGEYIHAMNTLLLSYLQEADEIEEHLLVSVWQTLD